MKPLRVVLLTLLAITLVALSACSALSPAGAQAAQAPTPIIVPTTTPAPADTSTAATSVAVPAAAATQPAAATAAPTVAAAAASASGQAVAGDLQSLLEQVYATANLSVVNIQVTESQAMTGTQRFFNDPNNPHGPNGSLPLPLQAEGSGFVWDSQGNIVTNNHVVDGASDITVTFYDGASAPATLVGRDADSDLAVIKVDPKGLDLRPVKMADSGQVRVGQFVVAIGNPFGLANTMTFGIVSAIGRSLPAGSTSNFFSGQSSYTIPDIIQTDAPINPGNSGGVLLDLQGNVLGVTSAIESNSGSNAGVGFAIPGTLVQNIVPSLIQTGKAQHPYIGISGTTLSPNLAQAMNLDAAQRGALVIDVTPGSPAEKAGLQASTKQVTVNGRQTNVGGDVIVKIDNQPVQKFDDLTAYLARSTKVGQQVALTVLRNGQQTTVNLTLGDRPAQTMQQTQPSRQSGQATPPAAQGTPAPGATPAAPSTTAPSTSVPPSGQTPSNRAWLGVTITALTPEVAQAMNLDQGQQGALVQSVTANSPAEAAGLRAGTQNFTTSDGTRIRIGGDVIVAVDGKDITNDQELVDLIGAQQPEQNVTLTVLRGTNKLDVQVTLGQRP